MLHRLATGATRSCRISAAARPGRSHAARTVVVRGYKPGSVPPVRDSRGITPEQAMLQAQSPYKFSQLVLQGSPFAWTKSGPREVLYVADPATAAAWLKDDWALGAVTAWPASINALLGVNSVAATRDPALHTKLRGIFKDYLLADAAVAKLLPGVQAAAAKHLARWAATGGGSVKCYDESMLLVFDVIGNVALGFGFDDKETKKWSDIFEVWNQGFVANPKPEQDPRFTAGMAAREQLKARFLQVLADPKLPKDSLTAKLRDVFGASSEVVTDNLIFLVFGGYETIASAISCLLWQLQQHPHVLQKIRDEQKAVLGKHGGKLTLESWAEMKYTTAAINEMLRIAQIVASSPRFATKEIDTGAPVKVPAGCPFLAAWGAMADRDPAVAGEVSKFKPERWLEPKNAQSLADYQHPFGQGAHGCMGFRLARATITAVIGEVALKYAVHAEVGKEFDDFPTGGRPANGLPLKLAPLKK